MHFWLSLPPKIKEKFQKVEKNLSRLKYQWASHEVGKKKDKYQQEEQLQQLKTACQPSGELLPSSGNERISFEDLDCIPKNPGHQNNAKQTQRKVFAGSRYTRPLFLFSTISKSKDSFHRTLQVPAKQSRMVYSTGASHLHSTRTVDAQILLSRTNINKWVKGQPKKIFIKTGKQLFGNLREGL